MNRVHVVARISSEPDGRHEEIVATYRHAANAEARLRALDDEQNRRLRIKDELDRALAELRIDSARVGQSYGRDACELHATLLSHIEAAEVAWLEAAGIDQRAERDAIRALDPTLRHEIWILTLAD